MSIHRRRLLILVCLTLLLTGCRSNNPIRIGFVAELSGRNNVLGVQGRNGAQLAIDEINDNHGINGQPLELEIYDDMGQVDKLQAADQRLIDSQVVAITGHMTSWESIAALDLIANSDLILFSPTTSTPDLGGKDDHFFRLISSNNTQSYPLADYLYKTLNLRSAALLYETDNAAYAQTYADGFIQRFTTLGGHITVENSYSSSSDPDFAAIVRELHKAGEADILLIVASSVDTALVAQQVRLQGWPVQLATANWAYTDELLRNGGRAVEGILLTSQFNANCQTPAYLNFKERFISQYGDEPSFAAVFSYETIQVLAYALRQTHGSPDGLAQAIIETRQFQFLCDQIIMDPNGDAERTLYLSTVQNGRFILVRQDSPVP